MITWFTDYHFLTWPYKVDTLFEKELCKFDSYNFIGNFILFFIDIIYTENDHQFSIWQIDPIGRQLGLTPKTYRKDPLGVG